MNARQVHAVLAAGVEDPTLISRWRDEPDRLVRLGIDPVCLDLAALWKFSGLTIKVRHNGVRQQLPCTFRLMAAAGLEISLFADYAAFRKASGQRYAAATTQRTHDLVQFITNWIDSSVPAHVLLGDIARHEHALLRLSTPSPIDVRVARSGDDARGAAVTASAVPHVCGQIVLHDMHCDPLGLAGALRHSTMRLSDVPVETRYYCYWRGTEDPGVAVLQLDEFGYYLLSLVDGYRSIADLSQVLGGRRRPTRGFTRSVGQLEQLGLLHIGRGRRRDAGAAAPKRRQARGRA